MDRRDVLRLAWATAYAGLLGGCGGGSGSSMEGISKMLKFTSVTTADGVRLNVVEAGNPVGPAIVFVHGISQSWLSWIAQLSDAGLRAVYRLVAFDLRGHGASQGSQVALDDEGVPLAPLADAAYNAGSAAGTAAFSGATFGALGATTTVHPASGHVNTHAEIAAGLSAFVELCYQDDLGRAAATAAQVQGATGFNLFTPAAVRLAIIGRAFDYRGTLAALNAAEKARVRVLVPQGDKVLQPAN